MGMDTQKSGKGDYPLRNLLPAPGGSLPSTPTASAFPSPLRPGYRSTASIDIPPADPFHDRHASTVSAFSINSDDVAPGDREGAETPSYGDEFRYKTVSSDSIRQGNKWN